MRRAEYLLRAAVEIVKGAVAVRFLDCRLRSLPEPGSEVSSKVHRNSRYLIVMSGHFNT
jgi:hypothetical protein